jgi:sigma-B regulation protein RsbU (phosphoserine phosphatase)
MVVQGAQKNNTRRACPYASLSMCCILRLPLLYSPAYHELQTEAWQTVPRKFSVARRIFITLTLLFAMVLTGVAVSMYITVAASVETAVLGNITRDMALAARDFEIWLSAKTGTLETLRHAALLLANDPVSLQTLLADATEADPDIPWIYFGTTKRTGRNTMLSDGVVRSGNGYYVDGSGWTPGRDYDWTGRPWFIQSKVYPNIVIGSPYTDDATGETVVSISLACRLEDGTLFGVLGADVRLSRLTTVVSMRRFTPNSRSYLVDRDGYFVTGEERISQESIIPGPNVFSDDSPLTGMKASMNAYDRTSGFLLKERLFYASSRVPRTNWLIIAAGPIADVAEPVYRFYRALLVISGIAMLAAMGFALLETRFLSRPIEKLKQGAIALAAGDLAHRVTIETNDEFGELGEFFNHVAVSLKTDINRINEQRDEIERYSQTLEKKVFERTMDLKEVNRLLRLRNDQMEEEVQMAAAVQRKIVPTEAELPKVRGLSFGARYLAMENVGGDLYDVLDQGDGLFAFIIGDVSGHGIPAALIAAMAKVSFRAHATAGRSPDEVMADVNKDLCELIGGETYFVSAFLAILDSTTGKLSFANAGHPPAYLRRAEGQIVELDARDGQLLGIADDFIGGSDSTIMETGDRLFMYTDGIIEARSPSGQFYDTPRLRDFFSEHGSDDPANFAGSLLDDVQAFCNGANQSDDRAVLIVGFDGAADTGIYHDANDSLEGASAMMTEGLTEEAASILEDLRKRRPEDPRIMNTLALVRLKMGDSAGAERLLRTATCIAPEMTEYADNLAAIIASKET